MRVSRLTIENFRGINQAVLDFEGHTLLVGQNNVGKSTVCEALDLVLGPDRLTRIPAADEHDFFNSAYLDPEGKPKRIFIEVILTGLSSETLRLCAANLEHWKSEERRLLVEGELAELDRPGVEQCLRLQAIVSYDEEEDDFRGATYFAHPPNADDGQLSPVPQRIKRGFGFLYLRALRTGSRALSLERGSLLDIILRLRKVRTGLWEQTRTRLRDLAPPIDESSDALGTVLTEIETRIKQYISISGKDRSTRLFVSQLTREHLRRTLAFFLSTSADQEPVPFQQVGTGTLNILVLALLTFIADSKAENVLFAMEEPETALPPHTQRRIAKYLLAHSSQCFVTSHSPYIIECFKPEQIVLLTRSTGGSVSGKRLNLPSGIKESTYRSQLRRAIAEAMLGQGVVVCEGISEVYSLRVIAQKMEEANPDLFPLDVAGVSLVSNDGDGNLSALGSFFKSLGLKVFTFYDKKARPQAEVDLIAGTYDIAQESSYKGLEALLATETPLERQWTFLEEARVGLTRPEDIPASRPSDDTQLREVTVRILKGMKGEGGAARLLESCKTSELPVTLLEFLKKVYSAFPKPTEADVRDEVEDAGAVASGSDTVI